jgi:hypothetical protein
MQDTRTGELKQLDRDIERKMGLQAAKDAIAPRIYQGPVFREGDHIGLTDKDGKQGRFVVTHIMTRNRMMLKGIAS